MKISNNAWEIVLPTIWQVMKYEIRNEVDLSKSFFMKLELKKHQLASEEGLKSGNKL